MAGTYRGRHASHHPASTTRRGLRDRRRGCLLRSRAGRHLAIFPARAAVLTGVTAIPTRRRPVRSRPTPGRGSISPGWSSAGPARPRAHHRQQVRRPVCEPGDRGNRPSAGGRDGRDHDFERRTTTHDAPVIADNHDHRALDGAATSTAGAPAPSGASGYGTLERPFSASSPGAAPFPPTPRWPPTRPA
jgi:hypothetical protein